MSGRSPSSAAERRSDPSPTPRAGVLSIPPYIAGEATAEGVDRVIRLASNESPLGASPKARAAYEATASQLERYPDASASALREAIGRKHDLSANEIICGCGSEELLHLAARAFAGPGDQVVVSQYGFIAHRIAALAAGASLVVVPERDCRVDFPAMSAAINSRTKIVYVANPANPTGTMAPGAAIRAFHASLPGSVLLVLDAAYAEFVDGAGDYECGLALVREGARNVFVTRTFSKMHGLAGLRIGWGAGSAEVVAGPIGRIRPAFNANSAGQAAAQAALEDDEFVRRSRGMNDAGLRQLNEGLARVGIGTTASVCNFVLARFPGGPDQAHAAYVALKKRGIILRPVSGYGLPDCLRISVGLPEDNAMLLDALRAFMSP